MLKPAERMAGISPFHVMDILAQAREMQRQGRDVIHLEVGEPDFSTPDPIVQAAIDSLRAGKTHYTPAAGLPQLREAISRYYNERFSVSVDPQRIRITPGASGALQLVLAALIDPGDQVLLPDPGYPCNRHLLRLFGGEAVMLAVEQEDDFQVDGKRLEASWGNRTRALLLASPANPTGSLIPSGLLERLYGLVRDRQGALIVDEIYQGLVYGRPAETALALGEDNLFVVNSFSKYFGMTGMRVGWLVAPQGFVDELDRLAQNLFLAAPTTAQYAALAAFLPQSQEILEERRRIFRERRDYLYGALAELGFGLQGKPEGAFYLYANIERFGNNSFDFAQRLLQEEAVAITPGIDFGSNKANRFLRFAYTTGEDRLRDAVARIAGFLARLREQ